MWLSLLSVVILSFIYIFDSPPSGKSGRSLYGYSVGILCAAAVLYLMWYGIRKRSYHSANTTLKGWLSAHVWLGLSLILAGLLHSGFRLGWNIHSLTYILMVIVIVSGIWGAINYKFLAPQIGLHRGSGSLKTLIEQFHVLGMNIQTLSEGKSDNFFRLRNKVDTELPRSISKLLFTSLAPAMDEKQMTQLLMSMPDQERSFGLTLVQIAEKKRTLALQIQKEIRIAAKLKFWLIIHLPVSIILLVALIVHVVCVLIY